MQEKAKRSFRTLKSIKLVFGYLWIRLYYIKGLLALFYITLNLCIWVPPLIIIAILKILFPFKTVNVLSYWVTSWMYALATWVDDFLLWKMLGISLEISGLEGLQRDRWYLVLSNHQSWADILILQSILNRRAPILRFLVKRELIYMPLVGQICWALDYPFLKRHTRGYLTRQPHSKGEDLINLQKSLDRSIDYPASLINLAEGTRFSPEKAKRQQSPYRYLLKPKVGGFKIIVQALGRHLKEIIDVTITYDQFGINFWEFISGRCKRVIVNVRRVPIKRIYDFTHVEEAERDPFALWLQALWKEKDEKIESMRKYLNQTEKM
jgi:1-acyl-sn-glycerol-3-phosphate acyltransferase